jgi:hypothetical protein
LNARRGFSGPQPTRRRFVAAAGFQTFGGLPMPDKSRSTTSDPACPHEDRIDSLIRGQESMALKLDANTRMTIAAGSKADLVLELMQGPDPLRQPDVGLMADVRALRAEQRDRETLTKRAKKIAMLGAGGAATALGVTVWNWITGHWK